MSINGKRSGVIGVNLIYGAFFYAEPEKLISSLQENLARGRIEVDIIKFSGPLFCKIDNQFIEDISHYHSEYLRIYPAAALAKLQSGDSGWERMVPHGSRPDHQGTRILRLPRAGRGVTDD